MPVDPFSRYRDLTPLEVVDARRGRTLTLPVRRTPQAAVPSAQVRQLTASDTLDLLAAYYFGRESLFWAILDANGGRLPDEYVPGETLAIPPSAPVTQVAR